MGHPLLFIIRPREQAQSGFRLAARGAVEAVKCAREMEARGLEVEIVDPFGEAHLPDELADDGELGPTTEQIGLIEATCDVLMSANTRAADIFYDRLFEIAPETRTMFDKDLSGQKRKLAETLAGLVGYLTHPELLNGTVEQLGRRHAGYGVEAAHYGPAGEALLAALGELLGSRFTPEVKTAWTALYSHVARVMLKAQRRAARESFSDPARHRRRADPV